MTDTTTWPLHPQPLGETDALSDDELLAALAAVHDALPRIRAMEQDLAAALGKRQGVIQGNLADGRQFTLKRTQDRKAWDHDDWKRDARRVIVRAATARYANTEGDDALVDLETGEATTLGAVLHGIITQAQEVHGSTQPRSTSLKALGLYAGDYCESSPGGWKFDAIAPKPTETTTEKDTTDA